MRKTIIISIILGLLVLGYIVFPKSTPTPDSSPVTPLVQVKTYPVPDEVLKVSTQLGLDQSIVPRIQYTIGSTGPCQGEGYWACYQSGHIWLKEVRPQYLAHEYLHYIWSNYPESNKVTLLLQEIYNNSPALQKRLQFYRPNEIQGELFPIICTEVADWKLQPELLAECTKWIPNRGLLPSYY